MRWEGGRRSNNVEDRRGNPTGSVGPISLSRKGGIGTVILVLAALYFGVDPSLVLQGLDATTTQNSPASGNSKPSSNEQALGEFVAVVLADTEDTWHALFKGSGKTYQEPKLVLFNDSVRSACGFANSAVGPFYCPGDGKVYIDLAFYDDLKRRFGAPGDFAQAYVIAHEIGHHVQSLLGISNKVQQARQRASEVEANALSVRLELQADCLAGIWAHHADRSRGLLENGDIDEALGAAAAIGDDRLQRQAKGYVAPDSFTHGSSAQRQRWFKQGFSNGTLGACNTFDKAVKL